MTIRPLRTGKKGFRKQAAGLTACFLACCILAACSGENSGVQETLTTQETAVGQKNPLSTVNVLAAPEYPVKQYQTEEEEWEARRNLVIGEEFSTALKHFSYETACKLLKEETKNAFYSPVSLYFALAATASGAEGTTQKQLLELLGYETEKQLAKDCRHGFQCLYQDQEIHKLQIASSLWIDQQITMNQDYLEHVRDAYFMEVYEGELSAEDTRQAMAQWVSGHTKGLIQPSPEINPAQIFSLMNTIYYYDEWRDQFNKDLTKEGTFTCGNGEEVVCDFMNQTMGSHGFCRGDNYTVSYLSTKNGHVTILLPDQGVDVHQFLESPEILKEALEGHSSSGEVMWKVPKFSYSGSYELTDMLKTLGVTDAFSPERADFTGMTQQPSWIDKVKQDTHIGIDENGIEAAAFTAIDWTGEAMPQGRADMVLDRPFLYVIENSGCILFVGICEDPTGQLAEPGRRTETGVGEKLAQELESSEKVLTSAPELRLGDTFSSKFNQFFPVSSGNYSWNYLEDEELEQKLESSEKVLTSAPELRLGDTFSSKFNQFFPVSSGNYSWNYLEDMDNGKMTSVIACGSSPLDMNPENSEILKIPYYNGALYSCSFDVPPDRLVVTEYDRSELVQEGITTEYEDSRFVELKKGKIYEITAWWEQDFLESRGFYGQAGYQVMTE